MKIGIQYYYCCQDSVYTIYETDNEEILKVISQNYESMAELTLTSKQFEVLINNEIEFIDGTLEQYMDCDYNFIYIICD